MSISFMALAWKVDIPSGRKLVLLALCDHANAQGECYPSVEAIARKCSMGQRTVQQHISELEGAGILMRRFRKGRSTVYRLEPHNFCGTAESAAPQDPAFQCAASGILPPQDLQVAPADPAPISISEPSMKSSINRQVVRGSPLPPTWTLPEPWAEWALQTQPTWTAAHVRFVAEKFRDHWTALPGQRGVKADWLATWRNWCRNEKPTGESWQVVQGALWTGANGSAPGNNALTANPRPGESFATFNARVMHELENGGKAVSRPAHAKAIVRPVVPTKSTISPANRAAALAAARALKSRLVRHEEKPHDLM
jgi:DNA-binding transcriptional ArsR family regulator